MFRKQPEQQASNVMFGGDGAAGVHVMGEQLREVDAPIEGMVGAGRGAINGAVVGGAVSAAVTMATSEGKTTFKEIMNKITSTHLGGVLGAVAAGAAISGFIRYSRAKKHNEWSQKHYDFMNQQAATTTTTEQPKLFTDRENERKQTTPAASPSVG